MLEYAAGEYDGVPSDMELDDLDMLGAIGAETDCSKSEGLKSEGSKLLNRFEDRALRIA